MKEGAVKKYFVCLTSGIIMFGLLMVGSAGPAHADLVTNGNFDSGLGNWGHGANVSESAGVVTMTTTGTEDARMWQHITLNPSWDGVKVEFDYSYVKDGGGNDFRAYLRFDHKDAPNPKYHFDYFLDDNDSTGWSTNNIFTINFSGIPTTSDDVRLGFVLRDAGTVQLDNVVVTQVPEPGIALLLGITLAGLVGVGATRRFKGAEK